MSEPIVVEFIDSATNEAPPRSVLKKERLTKLYRALMLLGKQWPRRKKYKTHPRPKRVVVFYEPLPKPALEYAVEFENIPSVSGEIWRARLRRDTIAEIAALVGENIARQIVNLKGELSRLDNPGYATVPWKN